MPVPRGLVNACEPGGMSRRCLAYQLAARGGNRSTRAAESGCHQKKGPSVFCRLPDLAENRGNEGPARRARVFYAQQNTSYSMGGEVYADKSILSGC
jgi:hypothetical protein